MVRDTPNDQTMRDFESWQRSLQDFSWLKSAVPGATDIDTCIHCTSKGEDHFLWFEYKKPGERLSLGQKILLDALERLPNSTVVLAYGPYDTEDGDVFKLSRGWKGTVDKEAFGSMVYEWWSARRPKKTT